MTFEIYCPCGQKLIAQEKHIGRQTKCPKCQGELIIPNPSTPDENENSNYTADEYRADADSVNPGDIALVNPYIETLRRRFEELLGTAEQDIDCNVKASKFMTAACMRQARQEEISDLHAIVGHIYATIINSKMAISSDSVEELAQLPLVPLVLDEIDMLGVEAFERILAASGLSGEKAAEFIATQNVGQRIQPEGLRGVELSDWNYELLYTISSGEITARMDKYATRFGKRAAIPLIARQQGFLRKTFGLSTMRLTELEYMLRVLERIVEADWIPGRNVLRTGKQTGARAEHEWTESVRVAVWLRDKGRCSECSAKEDVELTFIIPPSQGGAVNEHNSRLLCTKCRVKQGARA